MSTVPSFPNFQPDPEKQKRRKKAAVRETIKIADIIASSAIQARESVRPEVVAEYADRMLEGYEFEPIEVYRDPKTGAIYCWDGRHRTTASLKIGRDTIVANVRPGTERDAWVASLSANARHGLPRTNEDKRRAVDKALSDPEIRTWTDSRIATLCMVSASLVGSRKSALGLIEPPGLPRVRVAATPDGGERKVIVAGPKIKPTAKDIASPSFHKTPTPQQKTTQSVYHGFLKRLRDEGVEFEQNYPCKLGEIPVFSKKSQKMWWVMPEFTPAAIREALGCMLAFREKLDKSIDYRIVIVGRDNMSGRPWIDAYLSLRQIGVTFLTYTD